MDNFSDSLDHYTKSIVELERQKIAKYLLTYRMRLSLCKLNTLDEMFETIIETISIGAYDDIGNEV